MSIRPEVQTEETLAPGETAQMYLAFAQLFREAPGKELLEAVGVAEWATQADVIAVEFASLFLVPGEQRLTPYESAYCDTLTINGSTGCSAYFASEPSIEGLKGFIGGPSANAVREAYAKVGFELDPKAHELPDHLAIELEFMGRLLARAEEEEAKRFFRDHLGRWVFRCLDEIRQKSGSRFYRVAADRLTTFLRQNVKTHPPKEIPGV